MFLKTLSRLKVELEEITLPSELEEGLGTLFAANSELSGNRLTNATRAFFSRRGNVSLANEAIGFRRSAAPAAPPQVTVFREKESQLTRVVYKEIVVRFVRGTTEATQEKIIEKFELAKQSTNRFVARQFVAEVVIGPREGGRLVEITNELMDLDEIEFATPNFVSQFRRFAKPSPNGAQWHLPVIEAAAAWDITAGSASVVVAVLDDGVDVDHPNLKAAIVRPSQKRGDECGRDFYIPDDDDPEHLDPRPKKFRYPFDQMTGNDIHGTPCAGVIAARGVAGGAVGIAPKCRILPVKIFHADSLASEARVADAIRYAALHASVLSCSWSGPASTDIALALADAQEFGRQGRGALVFCATGNEAATSVGYPAADENAIGVGATTDQGELADYSNQGKEVWVTAPSSGGDQGIFTTDVSVKNRGFNTGKAAAGGLDGLHTNDFGGTSSATPLVAGVAALMLSANPALTVAEVKEILAKTATVVGTGYNAKKHSKKYGYGQVNAAKAVKAAQKLVVP